MIKLAFITIAISIISYIFLIFLFKLPLIHLFYETLESFIYYQVFTSTAQPNEHLIIIDEEDKIYNRDVYAKLIAGLDKQGAKVIAFDVLFAGNELVFDSALVTATQTASDKIVHALEFLNRDNHAVIPERFHLNTYNRPSPDNFIEDINGAILPFQDLLDGTAHLGHVTARSDIARRSEQYFPMIIHYNDHLYPAMPLLAVMKFLDCSLESVPRIQNDIIELVQGSNTYHIPVDNKTQTLINFIKPLKFSGKVFPMEKALEKVLIDSTLFQDKIVLIGNSLDSKEVTHGPHFQSYPNLFIFAGLISQILNNENIREGTIEGLLITFILLVLGIIWMVFISPRYTWMRTWYIYVFTFIMLLLVAIIALKWGVRIYIFLSYTIFCMTYFVSRQYYEKRLQAIIGVNERLIPLDYYVLIGPRLKKSKTYPVSLVYSPAGEDNCELKFPLRESEINKIREKMSQNFKIDIKTMKDFGSCLFEALFQPEIRDQYDKSLGIAYGLNTYLRLKLRFDAPDLACYPWEYMFDGEQAKEFLALHKNISITRFLAVKEPVAKAICKPPLKILVVIASPNHKNFHKLDVEKEKWMLKKALSKLVRRDIVQLRFLKKATLDGFDTELQKGVDIIHFIGHGGFSESLGGCLVFEQNNGGYELVNIDRISKLLEDKPIRLALLNACQTAKTAESDISLGVAQGLVKIGIPAVIAMQFNIPDKSAAIFSKQFYTTLAETFQVDRAVSEARQKMFINQENCRIDWGIPVLFMRKDDGIIFD